MNLIFVSPIRESLNILFVGDRIDKDINAAVKTGMQAVLKKAYTNIGKKIPKGVWKINQLSELPGLIEQINGEAQEFAQCRPER